MTAKRIDGPQIDVPEGTPDKPTLFANPFDDERMDDMELAESLWDMSYVPVYSELRRENDIRASKGEQLHPIPKLLWVRVSKPDGSQVQQSDEGMIEVFRLGFRACGVGDLKNYGFGMPPTGYVGPDGLIRRGVDLALFIVGEERANRNRERQRDLNRLIKRQGPASKTGVVHDVPEEEIQRTGTLRDMLNVEEGLPQL